MALPHTPVILSKKTVPRKGSLYVRVTANEGGHQLASAHVRAVIHQTWPRGDGYQHGKVAGEQWDSTVAPTYTSNTVKKDCERGPPADATKQSASQSWASNSI